MRTLSEQVAAVERRVKEVQQYKRLRRERIICISSVAACLLLIVGVGFVMPELMEGMNIEKYVAKGAFASIFYQGGAMGYALIGLLAFALGICVTILCYFLNRQNKKDEKEAGDGRAD